MNVRNLKSLLLALAVIVVTTACNNNQQQNASKDFINENIEFAVAQTKLMLQALGEPTGSNYPRRIRPDGTVGTTGMRDWTPGFFPGSMWFLYELTGDAQWRDEARKWTNTLEPLRTFTGHHDLGFMVFCSFGKAYRLAPEPGDQEMLVETAGSLMTRFNETVGAIQSWNRFRPWDTPDEPLYFPVIIDNMMNLELLFFASRVTGDPTFYNAAIRHADLSLDVFFREDWGTYHVVGFDAETGEILRKVTSQGYSDNSTWARGQAWAVYGFTMTYRETGYTRFRDAAINAANFFIDNLPEDLVPVWDFNVGMPGFYPQGASHALVFTDRLPLRDASAAAIVSSALFELGELTNNQRFIDIAIQMLYSLASPAYRAPLGENANFILMHSVGAFPQGYEIDTPLVYADYYFLEALVRYRNLMRR